MRGGRFGGRTGVTVVPFETGDDALSAACLPAAGSFLLVNDGDGDDRTELVPFVCIPAGVGRFGFVGIVGGGTAVTEMGAMFIDLTKRNGISKLFYGLGVSVGTQIGRAAKANEASSPGVLLDILSNDVEAQVEKTFVRESRSRL